MFRFLSFIFVFLICMCSCKNEKSTLPAKSKTVAINKTKNQKHPKGKTGRISNEKSRALIEQYFMNLEFDAENLQKQQLPIHKHFAEYLGLALKLYRTATSNKERKAIQVKAKNVYNFTLKPEYHNLNTLDFKNFKKNNMSYMRILFLLQELGFKNDFYKTELLKAKKRIDEHLKIRGDWQKCAFENYYNYFKLKKPAIINNTGKYKGVIKTQLPAEKYNRSRAYELTHLVFVAYEYAEKRTQTKFDFSDLQYLDKVLPKLAATYRQKRNTDLLSELVTSMKLLGTKHPELDKAITYLKLNQNNDGSWGSYEKARKKHGNLIELKAYLHNTLVVYESLLL